MKSIKIAGTFVLLFTSAISAQVQDSIVKKTLLPSAADSILTSANQLTDSNLTKVHSVSIRTQPDSAVIVVDDSIRGFSPLKIADLKSGEHIMLIKKKGYYQKRIYYMADSTSNGEILINLQQPGALVIKSEPTGAEIFLNNEKKALSPAKLTLLMPGEYSINLKKMHFNNYERKLTITSGKTDTLLCILSIDTVYVDSVKHEKEKIKRKKVKVTSIILASAFILFAAVIGIIDFSGDK